MAAEPVRLLYRFVPLPSAMLTDWRLNRCALAIWGYLYDCGYRDIPPDDGLMLMIAGLPPYESDGTEEEWKPASRRHLERMLHQLERAGYLIWHRGAHIHERFTVLFPRAHGESQVATPHAQVATPHALHPSIDHENQDQNNKGGGAHFYNLTDQGIELIRLGFFPGVAIEFQKLPGHQFRAIVSKAKQAGPEHIGAVVEWARARLREGWPEQERSNNHAENQPGRRTGGERRGREPQIDLEDLPEWLRNGG